MIQGNLDQYSTEVSGPSLSVGLTDSFLPIINWLLTRYGITCSLVWPLQTVLFRGCQNTKIQKKKKVNDVAMERGTI